MVFVVAPDFLLKDSACVLLLEFLAEWSVDISVFLDVSVFKTMLILGLERFGEFLEIF